MKLSRMQRKLLWRIKEGEPIIPDGLTRVKTYALETCLKSLDARKLVIGQTGALTDAGVAEVKRLEGLGLEPNGFLNMHPGHIKNRKQRPKKKERKAEVLEPGDRRTDPDWDGECECCGQSPVVPLTGMCGPCTGSGGDTAGGHW